jgi:hypothetical protein
MFARNRRMQGTEALFALVLALSWTNATVWAAGADELDRTGTLWAPYLEWSLENPSWPGNPYDLEASATFAHKESGEQRTTPMFYDGGNTWKFRFTATRSGSWSVRTSSAHEGLDGKRGTVTVQSNPDARARGFIVAHGNKYARQIGADGGLQAFVPNVYMNYRKFGNRDQCGWTGVSPTFSDPDMLQAYLDEAEEHGCNGIQALICNQWSSAGAASSRDHNSRNPDPKTFAALEQTIVAAHRRGMFLHIWGHYPPDCSAFAEGDYPNPEQLRTHRQFWRNRFLIDMRRTRRLASIPAWWQGACARARCGFGA